jgi:hypothetical protein
LTAQIKVFAQNTNIVIAVGKKEFELSQFEARGLMLHLAKAQQDARYAAKRGRKADDVSNQPAPQDDASTQGRRADDASPS